jgi:glutaconate CoA-transferase subunit B
MSETKAVPDFSVAELMVSVLSRELRDGEWGACGAFSQVAMAAFQLARLTHAPSLWWLGGGGGAINSTAPLVDSSSDYRTVTACEHVFRIEDVVDFEFGGWQKVPTVGILGGMQIDKEGNVNLVSVGDYHRPAVRGPGTVGLCFASHFSRTYLYTHHHDKRIFVEKVDFISAVGQGERRRSLIRPHSIGPQLIVTPLCVFGFRPDSRVIELRSVHPGHRVEEVLANTGFKPAVPAEVPITPAPTQEEVRLIREVIDPDGVLKGLPIKGHQPRPSAEAP